MKNWTRASGPTPKKQTENPGLPDLKRQAARQQHAKRAQQPCPEAALVKAVRRVRAPLALVFLLAGLLLASCGQSVPEQISWYAIHSLKGEIMPHTLEGQDYGGLAQIAGIFRARGFRAGQQHAPLLVSNSTIHGSALALFTRGETVISILNAMGADALFVDSREFSYGATRLAELRQRARFPFVAANLRDAKGQIPAYLDPYFYHRGSATAFIGLVSPLLLERNLPIYVEGLSLADPVLAVREQVAALLALDKPPASIVLMAVGFKLAGDDSDSVLADFLAVPGLDVIVLGSRDARVVPPYVEKSPEGDEVLVVLENDAALDTARAVEIMQIDRGSLAADQQLLSTQFGLAEPDPGVAEAVFRATAAAQETLRTQIAVLPSPLPHVRDWESPLASFVLDSYLRFSGADVAVLNSGALGGGLEAGPVSLNRLYQVMPFQNNLVSLRVHGEGIKSLLRKSLEYRNDPARVNGFLQVAGIEFGVVRRIVPLQNNSDLPAAYTFKDFLVEDSVRIQGRALDPAASYTLITEQFLAAGGDGYTELAAAELIEAYPVLNFSVFVDSFMSTEAFQLPASGRMRRWEGGL